MIAHLRADLPAIPAKDDQIGLLLRHVTVNAVVRNWLFDLWMALRLVAAQTELGECGWVLLGLMNIVAGQTSHSRRLEAAAFLE